MGATSIRRTLVRRIPVRRMRFVESFVRRTHAFGDVSSNTWSERRFVECPVRRMDGSSNGRFVEWTVRRMDVSSKGRFVEKTFRRKDFSSKRCSTGVPGGRAPWLGMAQQKNWLG